MAIVFLRLYNTFFLLISCFLYPIILIQSYMGREKEVEYCFESKTKRARFSTFVIRIVDNLCVQQQYKWNTIKIRLPRSIFNVPYGSNFATILDYFISRLKKVTFVEWSFGGWGHVLVAVAVFDMWP